MGALPAEAHLNSTGMGPFYDGLMHFLLSPEDIVPVLALALLAGLRGASYGRRALFTLPGMVARRTRRAQRRPRQSPSLYRGGWFLLLGGLLAADAKLSLRVTTALAALLGVYHGYLNGTGMGQFDDCRGSASRTGICRVCPGRAGGSVRRSAARRVGTNCRPRRGKLDRSQRSSDARLGSSNALDAPLAEPRASPDQGYDNAEGVPHLTKTGLPKTV